MLPAWLPGIFFPTLTALITMKIEKELFSDVWNMKGGHGGEGAWAAAIGGWRERTVPGCHTLLAALVTDTQKLYETCGQTEIALVLCY